MYSFVRCPVPDYFWKESKRTGRMEKEEEATFREASESEREW